MADTSLLHDHPSSKAAQKKAPDADDEWESGNWAETWKKMEPLNGKTPTDIPEDWETIERHGLRWGRPKADLVS